MVRRRYFAHTSRAGVKFSTRIRRTSYFGSRRWAVGENLAWGARRRSTPQAIVRSWLDSPAHRRNLLDRRWRDVGVAIVRGTPRRHRYQAATYATEFGMLH